MGQIGIVTHATSDHNRLRGRTGRDAMEMDGVLTPHRLLSLPDEPNSESHGYADQG